MRHLIRWFRQAGRPAFLGAILLGVQAGAGAAVVGISRAPADADIASAVRQAVALAGGLPSGIGYGKKIVIQPNLVGAGIPSGTGVVTDARVVRAVIGLVIEMGASPVDITICEGSAGFSGSYGGYGEREMTWKAFRDSGLDANADREEDAFGVRLADANDAGGLYPDYPAYSGPYSAAYVTRVFKPFLIDRVYVIPNLVAECDYLIRIPLVKNHHLAGVTGALKLAAGFAPTDVYHLPGGPSNKTNMLHQTSWGRDELTTNAMSQADMTMCRPPDFAVMDGLVGITNGPMGGDGWGNGPATPPAEGPMRLIAASADPVALDTVEALMCGYRTGKDSVPGLYYSGLQGLGTNDPAGITVAGAHVSSVRRWFPPWGSAGQGDTTPPVLDDIQAEVSGRQLTVTPVGARDTSPGLCKAEMFVDGALAATSASPPLTTTCSLAGAAPGEHSVTYTLYDGMLNEVSITRAVTVGTGPPIAGALALANGQECVVGPVVFAGRAALLGPEVFFVTNALGTSGLRVHASGPAPNLTPGQSVALFGRLGSVDGQRVLKCSSFAPGASGPPSGAKFMQGRTAGGKALNGATPGSEGASGPYNVGCLIRSSGVVTEVGVDHFTLTDGSIAGGIRVLTGRLVAPAVGSMVIATGFCCLRDGRALVVPRGQEDLSVYGEATAAYAGPLRP